ncbi:MAG: 2-succinyl-5-enolpyruvyl-6-hydroxy-3-cyclohexene-1-carboxylic-acid synthase [Microbacteriaceae bacterium]|nr:MAG: 2-succinyl-5-enolpyruvyl-6-hydroxy-3-cyclohexene-1-carboxylic-acid synthase [Microbacteriaceae bacterium]
MPEGPSTQRASAAGDYSIALLSALVQHGVGHIVLSPGSRSQALALVAAELERVGAIRLHVRIDERVSGFLALGLAVESGVPAVVITTSGTATANLHPAVLEAHHSGVPMIVLTADRPSELRGIRANQTTRQAGLYGTAVRLACDVPAPTGEPDEADSATALAARAWSAALGDTAAAPGDVAAMPGPVHLNVAFREPLSATVPDLSAVAGRAASAGERIETPSAVAGRPSRPARASRPDARRPTVMLTEGPRTVVVAGHGAGAEAEALANAGGWPLLAEITSGSRFGPHLIIAYRELLSAVEFGGRVERAIVFGHPTLSREIPALLSRDDVEAIVVAPHGEEFYNPGRRARAVAAVTLDAAIDPSARAAREWVGRWVVASRRLAEASLVGDATHAAPDVEAGRSNSPADRISYARSELAAVRAPVTRRMLAEALWRFTWPHDRLVFGASRLIREADRSVPGKNIRVHANRGLAGIDGTIATAIGIALAYEADESAGVTRVLLGDLALLHDTGALAFGAGESRPRIQVIVGNDGGGTIFDALEVARTAPAAAMDRVLLTAQHVDVEALAKAYGWAYSRASTHGKLDNALSAPIDGPSILEIPLSR